MPESTPKEEIPRLLPLIPIRDIVVFPHMVVPLFIGREMSILAVREAMAAKSLVFLTAQRGTSSENPKADDLHPIGTVASIVRMLKVADGRVKILAQGVARARIVSFVQKKPFFRVELKPLSEPKPMAVSVEAEAVLRMVKEQVQKTSEYGKPFMPEFVSVVEEMDDPGRLADLIVSNIGTKVDLSQEILETEDPVLRLRKVGTILAKEIDVLSVQHKIHSDARDEMNKTQRDYFLREQIKAIHKELGESDGRTDEMERIRKRIAEAKMPKPVAEEAEKQVKRLERMHLESAEATTLLTHLEWMVELPWHPTTKDHIDLKRAAAVLDEDHYGMQKVKERILEYLAVRKMKGKEKLKGPILCFVGPPGVGKTSMGRSIARAMGRNFVRIALGGIRDEAEIRGHRRTYIGALPGRILQGMKQAKTNNPLFMLDEIDKMGLDFRGDPSSALLEVLDPEQNGAFSDHYLGVPYDLSNVMFIATANQLDPLIPPLRDRMEVIDLSSYTTEEKVKIARQFLLPKQMQEHGLSEKDVTLTDDALDHIATHYTAEAGVRNLEREIARILRKIARQIAEGKKKTTAIRPADLHRYLGVVKFTPESKEANDAVGVACGLAWTANGGDMLRVEATVMKGKGGLTLTGHLGEVMKESASAALSYVRSRQKQLGIPADLFLKNDIHIHVPAGAIPKDGPSAGITMAAALASALTQRPIHHDVAMTGEVTLRGQVLPIGGLREKILAAKRACITRVVLPERNKKDMEEIQKHLLEGMDFVFADKMEAVFDAVLVKQQRGATGRRTPLHKPLQ